MRIFLIHSQGLPDDEWVQLTYRTKAGLMTSYSYYYVNYVFITKARFAL